MSELAIIRNINISEVLKKELAILQSYDPVSESCKYLQNLTIY